MFGIIKKYKLWYPWQMLRVIYYNFMRINRVGKSYLIPAPQAVFDIHKTASITLKNNLIFGWCNMKSSKWRQLYVWVRIPNSNVGGQIWLP